MQRFRVIAPLFLHSGEVELSPQQAHDRRHCLTPLGGKLYRIDQQTSFKVGEEIGLEDVSKVYEPAVEALARRGRPPKISGAEEPDAAPGE